MFVALIASVGKFGVNCRFPNVVNRHKRTVAVAHQQRVSVLIRGYVGDYGGALYLYSYIPCLRLVEPSVSMHALP